MKSYSTSLEENGAMPATMLLSGVGASSCLPNRPELVPPLPLPMLFLTPAVHQMPYHLKFCPTLQLLQPCPTL